MKTTIHIEVRSTPHQDFSVHLIGQIRSHFEEAKLLVDEYGDPIAEGTWPEMVNNLKAFTTANPGLVLRVTEFASWNRLARRHTFLEGRHRVADGHLVFAESLMEEDTCPSTSTK
jgi:hypothetical protein